MTEERKVHHVTRVIREDALHIFVVKNPTAVSGTVDICRNFPNARISRTQLPSPTLFIQVQTATKPLPSTLSLDALQNMIRDVFREDIDRLQLPS